MKTTLLIMAAGIGSRFGGGVKQLEPVGMHGEIIMDYSIHDAIQAGFNKIVFVIRKDIESDFKERIGDRIEKVCAENNVEVCYAFQNLSDIPGTVPEARTKPWGTGQAVLAARDLIAEPFLVINADDYYGKSAFVSMYNWLNAEHAENAYAMAGFVLKNTLSENGGVTRGICEVESVHGHVVDVVETRNIVKTGFGAAVNGVAIDPDSYVSMNMWGFPGNPPRFMDVLAEGFADFLKADVPENPLTAEYLLPTFIGGLLRSGSCMVKMLETNDRWFGITYREDIESVVSHFREMIRTGTYDAELYRDLYFGFAC